MKTASTIFGYRMLVLMLSVLLPMGSAPSRQALIEEARLTGDWTRFKRRMAAVAKHGQRNRSYCPSGTKLWCTKRMRKQTCSCMSDEIGRE